MSERIEVQRTIRATPAEIFSVLRDPSGHVDIDSSGMLMAFTGSPVDAVGKSFVVHMDREALGDYPMGEYDVEVSFTAYQPDVEIAWTILGAIKPPIGHVYGYRLNALDADERGPRTEVTSYYDWSAAHPDWKPIFPVLSEANLKATLGILARVVARRD